MRLIDADALYMSLGSSDRDIYVEETLEEAPTIEPTDILAGMWVPVTPETMPKNEEKVLVCYEYGIKRFVAEAEFLGGRFFGAKDEFLIKGTKYDRKAIYWMKIPKPPQESEDVRDKKN